MVGGGEWLEGRNGWSRGAVYKEWEKRSGRRRSREGGIVGEEEW
jgi:hypothetical protein